MKKPNVLFISSWYPSEEHATLGNFVQRHAEAIATHVNLSVLVVVPSTIYSDKFTLKKDMINGVNTTIVYQRKTGNKLTNFRNYIKAFRFGYNSINQNFEITHCNVCFKSGLFALELKNRNKIPYVLTEHWTIFLPHRNEYKTSTWWVKRIIKKVFRNADMVCPVSDDLAQALREQHLIHSPVKVIPNVVDTNLFVPTDNKQERVNFLHISTLNDKQKNFTGILNAFKKLNNPKAHLTVVTDGDIIQAKQKAKELGLGEDVISFYPTQSPADIVKFYQQADAFILFSNYESFSIVLAESWACGVPVIYSKCGGLTNIKDDKLGIQVAPKNETQLIAAMQEILKKQYDKAYLRQYAVQNFSNDVVGGGQYAKVYQEVLKTLGN